MTAASTAHAHPHPHEPAALVMPDPRASRVERRRRKTDSPPEPKIVADPEPATDDALTSESTTLAAAGALGLAEPRDAVPVAPPTALPAPAARHRGSATG